LTARERIQTAKTERNDAHPPEPGPVGAGQRIATSSWGAYNNALSSRRLRASSSSASRGDVGTAHVVRADDARARGNVSAT